MPGKPRQLDAATNLEYLSTAIPKVFEQVQVSLANHQKNCVALHKIHTDAATVVEKVNKTRGVKLSGERAFGQVVHCLLLHVLPLKKSVTTADRVIKFIGSYTKFINEKADENTTEDTSDPEDEDTTATRFTARLLKFLLQGIEAKDRNVRYRVLQTLVEMVSHLGEIDEEIYNALRDALLDRVKDKEANVRSQAVVALSKLCAAETTDDIEDGQISVMEVLLDALAHDTSSDVRRAVLLNLPINTDTLPYILDRMRDVEVNIRKILLTAILEPNITQGNKDKVIGPTHPRTLTITQRELVVKNGLGDREDSVRAAASSLIGAWIDVVNISSVKAEDEVKAESLEEKVLALLHLFDLGQGIAADGLLSVFTTRPDILGGLQFNDDYWKNLTPERAFLARVFVDHCVTTKDDARLEAALPVVTALAFYIQHSYNILLESIQSFSDDKLLRDFDDIEVQEREEDLYNKELILGEMLKLAVNLDYSDETGRRKMFQLVRDMSTKEVLPESLVGCCLDVLRKLSVDEKDLIRVIVEVVGDLRDPFLDEPEEPVNDVEETPAATPKPRQPPREKTEAEKKRALEIDSRCLTLSIAMLERVNTTFEENSTLEGLMRDLIIPSICTKDAHIRERAFVCLGLCCSIAQKRALDSIDFFKSQILSCPDKMKPSLYKILFDMLMVHEVAFARSQPKKVQEITDSFLMSRLREERDPKVLATICLGISKLILAGIARDINSVANLMLAFLSPATAGNQELRQCLTTFFPVYSYSSVINQSNLMGIFLRVFSEMKKVKANLEEDEEITTAPQLVQMFVDLTDPTRLSSAITANGLAREKEVQENESLHLKLAIEILKEFLKPTFDFDKDDRKVLCQMFSKLHIPDVVDDQLIRKLKLYIDTVQSRRPLRDAISRNALAKLDASISKRFEQQLDFKEEELRKLEELQDLFEFLDDINPDDDIELIDHEPKRRGRKRRSMSVTSSATTDDEGTGKAKAKPTKRRRVSGQDDDDEADIGEVDEGTPQPTVKTRVMPKRAATGKIRTEPIVITDSEDEDYGRSTPRPSVTTISNNSRVKEEDEDEEVLDRDISRLLEPPSPPSSLSSLDNDNGDVDDDNGIATVEPASEDEEEEAEVSGLLAED